jgi:Xaa-Pro aminopeptidase
VSGRFNEEQRETWNIFVAAYQAGAKSLREGSTVEDVFNAWRTELPLSSGEGKKCSRGAGD